MLKKLLIIMGLFLFVLSTQPTSSHAQDENALITAARAFVELLVKKDFTAAVTTFDDTMKTALPEPKLQETWNAVLAQVGAFKQAVKTRTEKRGRLGAGRRGQAQGQTGPADH